MQLELLHNTTVLIECDLGDWIKSTPNGSPLYLRSFRIDFKFYEHIKN